MSKELLITGGAGFIGLNFIQHMLKNSSFHMTIVDALTYSSNSTEIRRLAQHERVRFFLQDLTQYDQLEAIMDREYDVIVHFAAESHVDKSIVNAEPFLYTNIIGTYHLLKLLQKGYAKKMIHISTDEVYGTLEQSDPAFTEQSPVTPHNPYSATKASSDFLVLSYFNTHQLPVIITRCSNNYGPYQHVEKFIPKIIHQALNSQKIPVYGDGLQIRDWLFVEDHCRAIHSVIEKGHVGEVYNIGGGNEKTNIDVVKQILNKLSKSEDLIDFVEDRKGHDRRYAINSQKIKDDLGWVQLFPFEQGLDRTIDWYVKRFKGESV